MNDEPAKTETTEPAKIRAAKTEPVKPEPVRLVVASRETRAEFLSLSGVHGVCDPPADPAKPLERSWKLPGKYGREVLARLKKGRVAILTDRKGYEWTATAGRIAGNDLVLDCTREAGS